MKAFLSTGVQATFNSTAQHWREGATVGTFTANAEQRVSRTEWIPRQGEGPVRAIEALDTTEPTGTRSSVRSPGSSCRLTIVG
jgi:hypothetical protein